MNTKPLQVLFLCTGNSARSIMAEALLNHYAEGRFRAYSAGSHPTGKVNPFVLETLSGVGINTEGLSSKSWNEFATAYAPGLDIVITVCDNAAGETCPIWYSAPVKVHWGFPDPAAAVGPDVAKLAATRLVFGDIQRHIHSMVGLALSGLPPARIRAALEGIAPATKLRSSA